MRIKICGITRAADAVAASEVGADLIGLNFCRVSPRFIGDGPVEPLLSAVEPPAVAVAVTVNATTDELDELTAPGRRTGKRGFGVVQLHGDEPPSLADHVIGRGAKVIKAFAVGRRDFAGPIRDWVGQLARPAGLLAVLLDTAPVRRGPFGGSGRRFDWNWIAQARQGGELDGLPPIILAGGLTPSNVGLAVRLARPWGVDVAGGVEVEDSPGIKSIDKIRDFIRNARVERI